MDKIFMNINNFLLKFKNSCSVKIVQNNINALHQALSFQHVTEEFIIDTGMDKTFLKNVNIL